MSTFDYIKQSSHDTETIHRIRLVNSSESFIIAASELASVINNPRRAFFTPFNTTVKTDYMWLAVQHSFVYNPDLYRITVVIREMEKHQGSEHVAHRERTQQYTFDEIRIADMKTTVSLVLGFKNNGSTIH
jgi:hypothetical protein